MSHVSETETQIDSLSALKAACDALGYTFVEGRTRYTWYGQWVGDTRIPDTVKPEDRAAWIKSLGTCDHCIQVPGAAYEIGVVQQGSKYLLRYDYYSTGGLEKALGGRKAEKLVDAYNLARIEEEAKRQGRRTERIKLPNGKTLLRVHVQG